MKQNIKTYTLIIDNTAINCPVNEKPHQFIYINNQYLDLQRLAFGR